MNAYNKKSPVNILGKILFRNEPPWQRRRKTLTLLWTVGVGLSVGIIVMVVVYLMNKKR